MTDQQHDKSPPTPGSSPGPQREGNNHDGSWNNVQLVSGGKGHTIVGRDLINPKSPGWWVKVGVILTALGLLVAAIVGRNEIASFFDRMEQQGPAATAKIVNTGADGAVFAYPGPDDSAGSKVSNGGWREGQSVGILCQVRDGRPISDPAYPGGAVTSTVWDRVQSTGEPKYIPDIYTSLAKTTEGPPPGIPTC